MRLKIWGKGLLKIIWVIFVILLVGLSFPQIYGMKCYSVMSGSMSPDLPVGSAIYVKEKEPEKVEKGEIITFTTEQGRTMITHRVAENNKEKHFFCNKRGFQSISGYKTGKVGKSAGHGCICIPFAGYVLNFTGSRTGKIAAVFFLFAIYLATEIFEGQTKRRVR
ncbi:MAG: signal peptidase I [Ruminococcus sp.]